MKKIKTKSGEFRFYGSNGLRISKAEFIRRQKISRSLKKSKPKAKPKTKSKAKAKTKAEFKPTHFKTKPDKQFKQRAAKRLPFLKKWTKKEVVIPSTKEEFTAFQKTVKARTDYTDNPLEILETLMSKKEDLKKQFEKNLKAGDKYAIGYNFKFKFEEGMYEKDIVMQRGFTDRRIVPSTGSVNMGLDKIFEEIAERFSIYMSRQFCLGVKLDSLTIETIPQ